VIVRAVVNTALRSKDPFEDPIVDLTTIIQILQANDDALGAIQRRSREAGDDNTWRKAGDL
jgi:hypothetical protein